MNIRTILSCSAAMLWLTAGGITGAYAADDDDETASPPPSQAIGEVAGNYLSGQFARNSGNMDEAIVYLRSVHHKSPEDMNVAIQLQGLLLLQGQFNEAFRLAEDIENSDTKDPLADLVLALREIKNNNPDEAAAIFQNAADGGSVQLWMPLLSGWVDLSRHKLTAPITVESLGVDVGRAVPLVNYHLALINSQGGFKDAAAKNFKDAIEDAHNPPERVMKMLLKFYEQNDAPEILTPIVKAYNETHPSAENALNAPTIATPIDGVAEVLYTMGGIMYGAGVINDAAIYLQLATYVKPELDEATVALGDAYSELRQYARSNDTFAKITPQSPLYAKAQLHIAINYERMDKLPEALKRLDAMSKASPGDVGVLITKGDLLRIHSRFPEAVAAYSEALRRMPQLDEDAWPILFARASCLDREGKWPEAERDLQQALVLKPDQPDVLNYLGFARLEHGERLKEAEEMIAKAVKARPNDAQIIDSMGWVLYLQGDYQESTGYLEKAVELIPGDPTVNDHLGDVYWRLGRKTEARFQWERSLSFSPDEKLAGSIHKKLKEGLPPTTLAASNAAHGKPTTATP